MNVLVIAKRQFMGKDLLDDRYGPLVGTALAAGRARTSRARAVPQLSS